MLKFFIIFIFAIVLAIGIIYLIKRYLFSTSEEDSENKENKDITKTKDSKVLNEIERVGDEGEEIVKKVLDHSRLRNKILINDYYTYNSNGQTAQIDHILISSEGVFCVETKNYSGKIYGDADSHQWTQYLDYGNEKNKFYNPLKQNITHYYILRDMLSEYVPIYSIVVFVQNNAPDVSGVFNVNQLYSYFNQFTDEALTIEEIKEIESVIRKREIKDENIKEKHVNNIHEMQELIDNNICPRCGGQLVLREGEFGYFYGCENFPRCRFTKDIDDEE